MRVAWLAHEMQSRSISVHRKPAGLDIVQENGQWRWWWQQVQWRSDSYPEFMIAVAGKHILETACHNFSTSFIYTIPIYHPYNIP